VLANFLELVTVKIVAIEKSGEKTRPTCFFIMLFVLANFLEVVVVKIVALESMGEAT